MVTFVLDELKDTFDKLSREMMLAELEFAIYGVPIFDRYCEDLQAFHDYRNMLLAR